MIMAAAYSVSTTIFFSPLPTRFAILRPRPFSVSLTRKLPLSFKTIRATPPETIFLNNFWPEDEDAVFDPPTPPEGYIEPPYFDEFPKEDDDDVELAYEELYGSGYSGVTLMGNNVYEMNANIKKLTAFGKVKKEKIRDCFNERVVEVRRVSKATTGGRTVHFRAIMVVGDKQGQVGVGVGNAETKFDALDKSAINARRNIITVPLTKYSTFPHRSEGDYRASKVILRPAAPGTGVIAGGAVRIILEMAGVENALGKQLGGDNALNNAKATIVAIQKMRHFSEVAKARGIPMEELWK